MCGVRMGFEQSTSPRHPPRGTHSHLTHSPTRRPTAHPTTAVTRVRASQPGPLRVINYLYQGTPAWTPAVPIYPLAVSPPTGAPADSLPTQLQGVVLGKPDAHSLFWKSRRLTALIFQASRYAIGVMPTCAPCSCQVAAV